MDYTNFYKLSRQIAIAQGVTEEQYDRAETWYYDETDNVKHLVLLDNKKVNANENTCFVLGGIQAENIINDAELHAALGKAPGTELKSTKNLRGDFVDILRKETMTRVLDLINARGWHIHFIMVQIWYYAFVDIIDSIIEDVKYLSPMKDTLYRILKSFSSDTIKLFSMYKYPNIKNYDKESLIEGLIAIINNYMSVCDNFHHEYIASMIKQSLIHSKDKELVFLQDEKSNEWVAWFVQFYRAEIYNNPNKTLVMDTEKLVEKEFRDNPIMINGKELKNFRFVDSSKSPMIQVCDSLVS